jgi:hypothetical protein
LKNQARDNFRKQLIKRIRERKHNIIHKSVQRVFTSHRDRLNYIRQGRRAIEQALLSVHIRPRALNAADDAEIAALFDLLEKYNTLMDQNLVSLKATETTTQTHEVHKEVRDE